MRNIKIHKIALVSLSLLTIFMINARAVSSPVKSETLQEQLDRIQKERDALQGEIDKIENDIAQNNYIIEGYSSQVSKIYGEVQVFQKDIDNLELQIQELEISIKILEEEIQKKNEEIEENKKIIAELEDESKIRIKDNYKSFRINGGGQINSTNVFHTESINEYFKDSQYLAIIQDDTNEMLNELANLKAELEAKKAELDASLSQVIKDKEEIEIKKVDLAKKRDEVQVKIAAYYDAINTTQNAINDAKTAVKVFSEEEAQKQTQAERIRNELFNSYTPTSNGEFVTAGRPIGNQGCTGLCTGPHLHFIVWNNGNYQDPCAYLAGGVCGYGSGLQWPMVGNMYFTSGFGSRCFDWNGTPYCDFHNGIDLANTTPGAVVFAAHDGYAYKGVDPYGALYVVVCSEASCTSGVRTGYWHLSSY
jgi:septal ring factor EnvC (AmiA/AmiB activator)